jgi:serine/threonine protein kinase
MALTVGDIVQDKYRIVRLIGEGGMGAVYEGENTLIARRVAIKVLHGSAAVNPDIVQRFQREAQAAGRIGNDHILEVLDLGHLPDGDLFMVMEYLNGENLADRIDRLQRLTPQQAYPIVRQILEGLAAAHGAGIIHRDLKPENIFILREKAGYRDFVKIIDFGISKFNLMEDGNMAMTATGAVMGTPYYMSPEQAKGSKVADRRSDIYAVGVILYKAITGDEPFSAETFNELLFKIVLSDLVPARRLVPTVDEAFDTIISKAMAKDPDHRFRSCEDMIRALDAWAQSGKAVTVPPPAPDDPRVAAGLVPAPEASPEGYGQLDPRQSGTSDAAGGFSQSDAGMMALPGLGHQTPGTHTPGTWADQSSVASAKTRSHLPLIAGGALFAMLVVVLGAVGIYKLVGSSPAPPDGTQAEALTEGPNPAVIDEKTEVTPAPKAEPAKETRAEFAAEASATQPEVATGQPQAHKPQQSAVDAGTQRPKPRETAAPAQPKPRPAVVQPRPRPVKPRPPTGTAPDFGY